MGKPLLFVCLLLLAGCGTGRIASTETKPHEAIVFGRMTFEGNLPLTSSKVLVHFNERLWGKNVVCLDEEGYFYTKLPLGENDISLLEYRKDADFFANLPRGYASVNLEEADKIYYVGDITVEWTPYFSFVRNNRGIANALAYINYEEEALPFTVTCSDSSLDYFKRKFPDATKEIVVTYLKIE
jgi:hypothetical protein